MSERLHRNQLVIDEFRSADGVVGGDFAGVPLLLLTTTGARSGERRTMPLTFLRDGARLVVFGANGGRENRPGWYYNLLADPSATVEVGSEAFRVTARVTEGAEREQLWARQLPHTPYFEDFQERAERPIPVIALTRVDA
ncbi:nitroreductase family deazaflavin-dependent oxidoreductase [Streptacidiphilus carbonis]|uniref:nitroreductase family deazaflavin-dependent oxidoreductase n=1 Tax=Streptacidiphilus carbonis TaxID=105422 RepID=UPI0005A6C281|nr:nitroreductase family deazaflavin-dependent oxidoreductase [Streptacidiphilus carbonis]